MILDQFHTEISHLYGTALQIQITFWKKYPVVLRVNMPLRSCVFTVMLQGNLKGLPPICTVTADHKVNHWSVWPAHSVRNANFNIYPFLNLFMLNPLWTQLIWGNIKNVKPCNISNTRSKILNVSCLVLQLFFRNLLKLGVQSRMKMQLEQQRR